MADTYSPPGVFGSYPAMVGVVNVTGKAEIAAMFVSLRGLFGSESVTTPTGAAHPDFNKIPPSVRNMLFAELTAFAAAIAASPSA